jgi:hypothetical protein
MEYKNSLLNTVATCRWLGLVQSVSREKILNCRCSVDIDGSRNVSTGVLVVETTIDNMELGDLIIESAVKQMIELEEEEGSALGRSAKNSCKTYRLSTNPHQPVFPYTMARKNFPVCLVVSETRHASSKIP